MEQKSHSSPLREIRHRQGGQEERQAFIDFRLNWFGQISRADISENFKTSLQQASVDLKRYRDDFDENISYDISARKYVATKDYTPQLSGVGPKALFRHIRRQNNARLAPSWLDEGFPAEVVPPHQARRYNNTVLKGLVSSCVDKYPISLDYVSGSTGRKERRSVSPHTIVGDSIRWHIRAFDHDKNRFSDYVISRISSVQPALDEEYIGVANDTDWKTHLTLVLEPQPGPKEWMSAIAKEFKMKKGQLKIRTRKALLFYVLRRYGFNPRPPEGHTEMRNESSQLLSISDLETVESWLGRRK